MLDIREIREDPDRLVDALSRRDMSDVGALIEALRSSDTERRDAISKVNELKARRNAVSKQVGELKRTGESAEDLIVEMRKVGDDIDSLDQRIGELEASIGERLLALPNAPHPDVQPGGEDDAHELSIWGTPPDYPFEPRPHWELGEELGVLDLARGSKVAGSGFPVLKGKGARLQRALINYMLDLHGAEHGYQELRVPYLVTQEAMTGTGQLPKFAEESYQTERDALWLIPTAEVPVTNLHRDELMDAANLPVRYVAYSPCFRREAGAAGKDTRGLLRVHQFDKVELVRYETPERSLDALQEMTREACTVLERLGLPYRVIRLAGGDLGFASAMTYDIEVWAPGVERWLEVSSCSTFTDYQARRANIRYRPAAGEKPRFVHTLNGSALALPRVMVALFETYQESDGSIRVPEVLAPLVGFDRISP